MKKTTMTKYEASDGKTFSHHGKARAHELEIFAKGFIDDGAKLTVPKLIEVIVAHPAKFTAKLEEMSE